MLVSKISNGNNQTFTHSHNGERSNTSEGKNLQRKVMAASALGVGTAYALIAKKQGFSLSPKKIYQTPIKDWAIFKLYQKNDPNRKLIELEEKEILALAGSSVAGGFAGGAIFDDKKNIKAKARESLNQILGNVLIPVLCVGGVSRLYGKYKTQIINRVPQLKETGKSAIKTVNRALRYMPSILMTGAGLGIGIIAGNKVSNFINEKLYNRKVERDIKATDFAPHVDDLSMAVTLMAKKSPISTAITNTVPLFLCVPGIQTGMAEEKE